MKPYLFLLAGCIVAPTTDPGGDPTGADQEQYRELEGQLEKNRSEFLGKNVQDLMPLNNQLFWLDNTSFDPKLRRYDDATGAKLAYTFSIGSGDLANYRASSQYIVTADASGNGIFTAYDANMPERQVDSTVFMPPSGVRWNAYAVDGSTVYIVDQFTAGQTKLYRWLPGSAPTVVTTLEGAGISVGEFQDFGVFGTSMVLIESGRIWRLDLITKHATWLMNMTEVRGTVDIEPDGIMFGTATGVQYFDYGRQALIDITAAINKNPFQINETYASAAKYNTDFARYKKYVLYIGHMGLFAYDMAGDKVIPLLLEPISADLRIDYRYPVALSDGMAFVTGLTSTDGAVGADGPTYKLDLRSVLHE